MQPTDNNPVHNVLATASRLPQMPISPAAVASDVRLALDLANGRPTGEAADAVRARLRGYIAVLADPADVYAAGLADTRARDIATNTIRHARAVAEDPVHDPAANLRLLAKSVDHLFRYAVSAARRSGQR
ncbi:DUF6415 family natural product biosynthesis protein [Streptomyces sp. NPDC003036]|uniref:DUF6415 family natural product biosynthesis protein n=1 Tax=Streptomyces sp. NPDC003036 TaxID=3154442 RepID=UPI0033A81360